MAPCPMCRQDDEVEPARAIVAAGEADRAELAAMLGRPAPGKPPSSVPPVLAVLGGIGFLGAAGGAANPETNDPSATAFVSVISLAVGIIGVVLLATGGGERRRRRWYLSVHPTAMRVWWDLSYCGRCDRVFLPGLDMAVEPAYARPFVIDTAARINAPPRPGGPVT